mmetsp:Transcript_21074/g.27263  ORF Transcript_21074/g.27263 Transcript_21074/m.27263 type:complete len:115 (-) Transcript_21074:28-372(-)
MSKIRNFHKSRKSVFYWKTFEKVIRDLRSSNHLSLVGKSSLSEFIYSRDNENSPIHCEANKSSNKGFLRKIQELLPVHLHLTYYSSISGIKNNTLCIKTAKNHVMKMRRATATV